MVNRNCPYQTSLRFRRISLSPMEKKLSLFKSKRVIWCVLLTFDKALNMIKKNTRVIESLSSSRLANWIKLMRARSTVLIQHSDDIEVETLNFTFGRGWEQNTNRFGKHTEKKLPSCWIEIRQQSYLLTIVGHKKSYFFFWGGTDPQKRPYTSKSYLSMQRYLQRRRKKKPTSKQKKKKVTPEQVM